MRKTSRVSNITGRRESKGRRSVALVCGAFLFEILIWGPLPASAVVKLTPQTVVDMAVRNGLRAKETEYRAQQADNALEIARGDYDVKLVGDAGYLFSKPPATNVFSNEVDRTTTYSLGFNKKFVTGTTLNLAYANSLRSSTLSTFAPAGSEARATVDSVTLSLNQSLLANSFGYAGRLALEVKYSDVGKSRQVREEDLEEIILEAMRLFWDAYVAGEQLKENMAARDKYEQLVRTVRRKSSFNLSSPGELPRLEAELNQAESRVKTSSALYLTSIDKLLTAIQLRTNEDVIFDVPTDLPPVPQLPAKDLETLRPVKIAKTNYNNAELTLKSTKNRAMPTLDLVARATAAGSDPERSRSLAEMSSGSRPEYFVGVEFSTALDSSLRRGSLAKSTTDVMIARNQFDIARDAALDELKEVERQVAANFTVAKASMAAIDMRARVVRELEVSYRQGRQPLVELIRSYNELFNAQLERARAIGNYHKALNQWAAARDELVAPAR